MSRPVFWVRCRDGSLYKEPLWLFPEGFVRHASELAEIDGRLCELVLWLPADANKSTPRHPESLARSVLERVFGFGAGACESLQDRPHKGSANLGTLKFRDRASRWIPGTDPLKFAPATSYSFSLYSRPPVPTMHEGSARYATRLKRERVLDLEASSFDHVSLLMPSE